MSAPEVTFYKFNPDLLAQFMVQKDWNGCWDYLVQLMDSFSIQKNMKYNLRIQSIISHDTVKDYLNQFSGLMGELLFSLLTDPNTRIPDKSFYKLISMHEIIHNFFYLNGQSNTDELVLQIMKSGKSLSPLQQKRMLLLLSMDTDLDVVSIVKKTDSQYRAAALGSFLCYLKIYKRNIHDNKIKLLPISHNIRKLFQNLDDGELQDSTIPPIIACYFSCSYLDHENKHEIKTYLNDGFHKYLSNFERKNKRHLSNEMPSDLRDKIDLSKPKLLVFLELYAKNHAMQRSWDRWIRSLEKHFNVVIMIEEALCDDSLRESYTVLTFNRLIDFIQGIRGYAPDMIVLPSVGMTFWGIAAANMRLAPVQMMNLGHPASSMSAHIDFVYGQSQLYDERAFPADTYLVDDAPYKFTPTFSKDKIAAIETAHYDVDKPRPLRVSIVGTEFKMSYPFIALLKDIETQASFDVEFHFHLNSAGMDSMIVEQHLEKQFDNLVFYGCQDYESFLSSIGQTDIVLNPFPFGHTNTIIDTLLLGKPCVSYQGIEPSSRTETYILSCVGLEDEFLVTSTDEYKEKFFALAQRIMNGDTNFYDADKVYDLLYTQDENSNIDYGAHIKWVYENAQSLKGGSEKCITIPRVDT